MLHPLAPDLSSLSDEELHTKRGTLQTRLNYAYNIGNSEMVHQLSLLIQDYALEVDRRNQKMMEDARKSGRLGTDPEAPLNVTRD